MDQHDDHGDGMSLLNVNRYALNSLPSSPMGDIDHNLFAFDNECSVESHLLFKSQMIQFTSFFNELAPLKQYATLQLLARLLHPGFQPLLHESTEASQKKNVEVYEKANSIDHVRAIQCDTRANCIVTKLLELLPLFSKSHPICQKEVYLKLLQETYIDTMDCYVSRLILQETGSFSCSSNQASQSTRTSANVTPNSSFSHTQNGANCTETPLGQMVLLFMCHYNFTLAQKVAFIHRIGAHLNKLQELLHGAVSKPSSSAANLERLLDCTLAMVHDLADYLLFTSSPSSSAECQGGRVTAETQVPWWVKRTSCSHEHNWPMQQSCSGRESSGNLGGQRESTGSATGRGFGQFLHPNQCHRGSNGSQYRFGMSGSSSLTSSGFLSGSDCLLNAQRQVPPPVSSTMPLADPECQHDQLRRKSASPFFPGSASYHQLGGQPVCSGPQFIGSPPAIQIQLTSSPQSNSTQQCSPQHRSGPRINQSSSYSGLSMGAADDSFSSKHSCGCDSMDPFNVMLHGQITGSCNKVDSAHYLSPGAGHFLGSGANSVSSQDHSSHSPDLRCCSPFMSTEECEHFHHRKSPFADMKETSEYQNNFRGMKNVMVWLKNLRLHKYGHLFRGMTYEELLNVSDDWLVQENVTQGARNKILVSIAKLRSRQPSLEAHEARLEAMETQLKSEGLTYLTNTAPLRACLAELKAILLSPIKPPDDSNDAAADDLSHHIFFCLERACSLCLGLESLDSEVHFRLTELLQLALQQEALSSHQKDHVTALGAALGSMHGAAPRRLSRDARHSRRQSTGSAGPTPSPHSPSASSANLSVGAGCSVCCPESCQTAAFLSFPPPVDLTGRRSVERTHSAPNQTADLPEQSSCAHQSGCPSHAQRRPTGVDVAVCGVPAAASNRGRSLSEDLASPDSQPSLRPTLPSSNERCSSDTESPDSPTDERNTARINWNLDQLTRKVTQLAIEGFWS